MNVLAKTLLDGVHELLNDLQQLLRRRAITILADLVNRFFRTDTDIIQQIIHSAVSFGVPGLDVPGILSGDKAAVAFLIFIPLMLGKGRILTGKVFFVGSQTVCAVPVKVHGGSGCFDVFGVGHIEAAVIVLGIINAMLSCTAIVTGHPLLLIRDGRSPPSFLWGYLSIFAMGCVPRRAPVSTGNTQYKVSNSSGRCAFNTSLGQSAPPLDSGQGSSPCIPRRRCRPAPAPEGLPPSELPAAKRGHARVWA